MLKGVAMAEAHIVTDASACSTEFFSAGVESLREALSTVDVNDDEARVEAEIEASKVHCSELTCAYVTVVEVQAMELSATSTPEPSSLEWEGTSKVETVGEKNQRVAKEKLENVEVFRSLQAMYPGFFVNENDVGSDSVQKLPPWLIGGDGKPYLGEVKISSDEPFADGSQAQLFHAHLEYNDGKRKEGLAIKVLKEGTSLRDLQKWLPLSMLNDKGTQDNGWFSVFLCNPIIGARLLKANGRFAFLMARAWGDLRKFIDLRMIQNNNQGAPFSEDIARWCMMCISWGMQSLHAKGIVHRDLKAKNVLIVRGNWVLEFDTKFVKPDDFVCVVADYECSVGVVGTEFWRAPEILLALKNRNVHEHPEIFSKQADVYSYGMTCYEILTGCIPLGELRRTDYDEVIGGARPVLPKETPTWMADLMRRCWDKDSFVRPTFDEIVRILGREEDRSLLWRNYQRFVTDLRK